MFTTHSKRFPVGDASQAHAIKRTQESPKQFVTFKASFYRMDTGSGRKILIIEDESDVADLLEMGLRKAGFKTTAAADGAAVCRRRAITGPISSSLT